jgi:hypothetical protein
MGPPSLSPIRNIWQDSEPRHRLLRHYVGGPISGSASLATRSPALAFGPPEGDIYERPDRGPPAFEKAAIDSPGFGATRRQCLIRGVPCDRDREEARRANP